MRRREFTTFLASAALVRPVQAQSLHHLRRIGVLWPGPSAPPPPRMEAFDQGLRDAGLVQGQDVAVELRYSAQGIERLQELATELVKLDVAAIAAFGDLAPRAAQKATSKVPIAAIADDVLGAGLVTSLARPGGNTTGVTLLSPELSAKRLAVLKEMLPHMSRAALLWDPSTGRTQVAMTEDAARLLNVNLQVFEVRRPNDLAGILQAVKQDHAEGLNVGASPLLASQYRQIVDFAATQRLPAIYQWKEHAVAGGLAAYGPSLFEMYRETGLFVAKLLRGANPAELPVQQPTKFELVVNLATAKTLGLALSQTLLIRADEVIE
jgi:putative tryptophan/tyrosine transport system substrate-binding protein